MQELMGIKIDWKMGTIVRLFLHTCADHNARTFGLYIVSSTFLFTFEGIDYFTWSIAITLDVTFIRQEMDAVVL